MNAIVTKNGNDFSTQIIKSTGEKVNFDYVIFITELYQSEGECELELDGDFSDIEKSFLTGIFDEISNIFKPNTKVST